MPATATATAAHAAAFALGLRCKSLPAELVSKSKIAHARCRCITRIISEAGTDGCAAPLHGVKNIAATDGDSELLFEEFFLERGSKAAHRLIAALGLYAACIAPTPKR